MEKKKVLVGMSGGVDSAAAALLLERAGYETAGCTLKLYCAESGCGSDREAEDARLAAETMGLSFHLLDESAAFSEQVIGNFVETYCSGGTPNPCIECNRGVKFSALLRRAEELGMDYIATGHYARVRYDEESGRWQLLRGVDRSKDQSYVLYPLSQKILSHLLLPVGEYEKSEIRAMVAERGLHNAHKKDSQDICFVPDGDYVSFLTEKGVTLSPGDFVDGSGKILGQHRGQVCYTTGQRRGLGVSADRPLYVLRKDGQNNTVVLGDDAELFTRTVYARDFNWVSLPPADEPLRVTAKTRYSQKETAATLYRLADGTVRAEFDEGQRAVTAGQSLVCYAGELVVGGGIITAAE